MFLPVSALPGLSQVFDTEESIPDLLNPCPFDFLGTLEIPFKRHSPFSQSVNGDSEIEGSLCIFSGKAASSSPPLEAALTNDFFFAIRLKTIL